MIQGIFSADVLLLLREHLPPRSHDDDDPRRLRCSPPPSLFFSPAHYSAQNQITGINSPALQVRALAAAYPVIPTRMVPSFPAYSTHARPICALRAANTGRDCETRSPRSRSHLSGWLVSARPTCVDSRARARAQEMRPEKKEREKKMEDGGWEEGRERASELLTLLLSLSFFRSASRSSGEVPTSLEQRNWPLRR